MIITIDLDGTICENKSDGQTYEDVKPLPDAVETLNLFKEKGFYIIIFTARNMVTHEGRIGKINKHQMPIILDWLKKYQIPYDELILGKVHSDVFLDDKGMHFTSWDDARNKILNQFYQNISKSIVVSKQKHGKFIEWTDDEVNLLTDIYPFIFPEESTKLFPHRTAKAVREKGKSLGIKKNERKVFFPKEFNNDYLGGYISGFIDGEGSFVVSIRKDRNRINYLPKLTIALRLDDISILKTIRDYFDCGNIYLNHGHDNPQAYYSISALYDIKSSLIPHLEKYPLMAKKVNDYNIWKQMVYLQSKYFRLDWNNNIEEQMKLLYESLKEGRKYKEPDLTILSGFKTKRANWK